jgi:hypothetical protein
MSDERRLPWSGYEGRQDDREAITRELAEHGPYIAASDALGDVCAICGKVDGLESPLADPASHEPWCLWRRSKELHRGVGTPTA